MTPEELLGDRGSGAEPDAGRAPSGKRRTDRASLQIAAPPQALYDAFIDPARLMQWLPPDGMTGRASAYDFRNGGRYQIELTYADASGAPGKTSEATDVTRGRFLELLPGNRIVQSVEFESADPAFAGEMIMTWSFEPNGAGTKVTITAENVPDGITKVDHDAGLLSSLENLAEFVNGSPSSRVGASQP